MKNITTIILVLIFTAIGISAQEKTKVSDTSRDEAAMRANVEQMMKGWNAKIGADFAKPFAEDADYVVINGMQIKGREAIGKGHQGIFDTFYKNSILDLSVQQIRFLRPDVAVVHVLGQLKVTENNVTRSGNARMTLVMTKTGDKWEIASFQNTAIEAAPQKN
jgi:uncharacterized protein (TIGR02246 family)